MKPVEFVIQGQTLRGFVERVGSQVWVALNGKVIALESDSKKSRKKSGPTGKAPEILAPMPGKITSLKLKVGDAVNVGDVVMVMEAMKMEYSLKAQVKGKIKTISCKEQDQVTLGQLLAEIEGVS